jgi:hypothetical protein
MSKFPPLRGEISGLYPKQSPLVLSNLSVAHMSINNCDIPVERRPERRARVSNISIFECEHYACSANGALFHEVVVTELRGSSKAPSFLHGCAYSRVTLRGHMGGLWFSPIVNPLGQDPHLEAAYRVANAAEYRTIDWALDITEAQFMHYFSLVGIPASLIRRRPDHHFVMTRDAAQVLASDSDETVWSMTAQELIELGMADTVIVIGGSPKLLRGYLNEAARLRDRGLIA